jgi:formate-dependent nitrite reductase membrane component NrfD
MGSEQMIAPAPWGSLIGLYFILAGLASGTALLCWWIRPRDQDAADAFEMTAGLVALAAISACGLILIVDLDRPGRFFLMLTEFSNLGSVMSVGAKLIALKAAVLVLYLYLIHRRRQAHAAGDTSEPTGATLALYRAAPAILGVSSLGVAVYPAFLLSRTWMSPLATSPGSGLIFLSTAMLMGAAVAAILASAMPRILEEGFRLRVGRTLVFLLTVEGLLLVFEGLALHGNQAALQTALRELHSGSSSGVFWWLVVGLGLAAPLVGLVALPRNRWVMTASSVAVLVGASATRYLFFTVR